MLLFSACIHDCAQCCSEENDIDAKMTQPLMFHVPQLERQAIVDRLEMAKENGESKEELDKLEKELQAIDEKIQRIAKRNMRIESKMPFWEKHDNKQQSTSGQ